MSRFMDELKRKMDEENQKLVGEVEAYKQNHLPDGSPRYFIDSHGKGHERIPEDPTDDFSTKAQRLYSEEEEFYDDPDRDLYGRPRNNRDPSKMDHLDEMERDPDDPDYGMSRDFFGRKR